MNKVNKMIRAHSNRWSLGLSALLLATSAQGTPTFSQNNQHVEETLSLQADIDLSQTQRQSLEVISFSPAIQQVAWNPREQRFEDLFISLRVLALQNTQPLVLDLLSDAYQCAELSLHNASPFFSQEVNRGYHYQLWVQGRRWSTLNTTGGANYASPQQYRVSSDQWQYAGALSGVLQDRYTLDLSLQVALPVPHAIPANARGLQCSGALTLLLSQPLTSAP